MLVDNQLKLHRDILIVDDAFEIRSIIKSIIHEYDNLTIDEARNEQQALQLINKFNYQTIFLDIDLGTDNGLNMLTKFKQQQPQLKVIMISAHTTLDNVRKALVNGADGFIAKPFSPQKIISFLKS
jgi:DNA-binding NtrC family response regulator